MAGKCVSGVAAWIIGAAISVSVASFGIYINSAPIISVSCVKCESSHGSSCEYATVTEDFCVWGSLRKRNWVLFAIYITLVLASVLGVALIVERFLVLYNAGRQSREFQSRAGEALFRGQPKRAVGLAREYPDSPLAFVINATFAKQQDERKLRPSMHFRHQAIAARTIELTQGLWHLSVIGWLLALLALLALCADAINAERVMRYAEAFYTPHMIGLLSGSLSLIVYCVLAGFVILVAHRFFTARFEHIQLEMDRLSLAFIEAVTSLPRSLVGYSDQYAEGVRYDDSRITHKVAISGLSDDWDMIGEGGYLVDRRRKASTEN